MAIMRSFGGFNTGTNILIDDTTAQRLNGEDGVALQSLIDALDKAQDKDDLSPFRPERIQGEIDSIDTPADDGWYIFTGSGADNGYLVLLGPLGIRDRYKPEPGDVISVAGSLKRFVDDKWQDLFTSSSLGNFYRVLDTLRVFQDIPAIEALSGDRVLIARSDGDDAIAVYARNGWTEQPLEPGSIYLVDRVSGFQANKVAVVNRDRDLEFIDSQEAGLIYLDKQQTFSVWNESLNRWQLSSGISTKPYSNLIVGASIARVGTTDRIRIPNLYYEIYSDRDRVEPTVERVYQASRTITLSAAELSRDGFKYVTADLFGVNLVDLFASVKLLSSRIYLGAIEIKDGAIVSVTPFLIELNPYNLSTDLIFTGGVKNNSFIPKGKPGTKELEFPVASYQTVGMNFFIDSQEPHKDLSRLQSTGSWDLYSPDGTAIATGQTQLDFAQYFNGTSVVSSPAADDATARFLYYCPHSTQKYVMVLGKRAYANLNQIKQRYIAEERHVKPGFLGICKLVGIILGRKNFSDASNINHVAIISNLDDG